jgi:gliding motility-associated protein GldM
MSGGKETPRQKMIGMMYLVLTALLALNVSKEILNAFVIVENGLNTTNANFDGKNGVLYSKFDKAMADNKVKTEPWYKKAMEVKKQSAELCKMVDDIKSELYLEVQKLPSKEVADTFKLKQLDSKDNFDIPTHYMLGATPETPGSDAHVLPLKEAIIKYRKALLDLVPAKEKANLKLGLNTEDLRDDEGKTVSWEFNNFDHTTMAATMCILAGIKNDIKNAESDVVGALLKAITAEDFSFDAVEAKVVAPTSYIVSGEKYTADIFVSAHSSTQNPEIVIGQVDTTNKTMPKIVGAGTPVTVVNGVGKYEVSTGSEGVQEYNGLINVKAPDGSVKPYRFHGEYMVAKPSMAVSPTKMNVFYIGVDNPVDISVAGAAPTDVVASLTGATGSISNSGQGHYIVKVSAGTKCDINVSVKSKSGTSKSMGKMEFRIRKVPSPLSKFAGVVGDGKVSKGELGAAGGVFAELSDFVFDLKFPVLSWSMSMPVNGVFVTESAQGPGKTAKMSDLLSRAKPGTKVLIEEVKVQAPGEVRKIPGCVITVK